MPRPLHPFRTSAPVEDASKPTCDIFEVADDERLKAVSKYLSDLDTDARFQVTMLTELLDALSAENNELKEENLRLRNELDQRKKLQSG